MKFFLLLFSCTLFAASSFGARYWISNVAGNWNDPANWAAGPTGSGGQSVPDAAQTVYFTGNGLGNCSITGNVDVQGFRVNSGYTGTITHTGGTTFNIGTSHFHIFDGTVLFDTATVNVAGNVRFYGGSLTATSKVMSVVGDYQTGASTFFHNNGTVRIAMTTNQIYSNQASSPAPLFYNLEMDASNNALMTITSGDTVQVLNNFIGRDGGMRGSPVYIHKDIELHPDYDGGNSPIVFVGSTPNNVNFYNGNWEGNDWFVRKNSTSETVLFNDADGDGILTAGSSGKSVYIQTGTLSFEPNIIADIDFGFIELEANGILLGASKEIRFSGSYTNDNGLFQANNGLFTFDSQTGSYYSCDNTANNIFYNVKVDQANTMSLNIQPGDTLKSSNKTMLVNGSVTTGMIGIVDSCIVESTFDYGNSAIVFIESGTSWMLFNNAGWTTSDIRIQKSNTSDPVIFGDIDGDNIISFGNSLATLSIQTGRAEIQSGVLADINIGNISISSTGAFQGSDNEIRFSGNFINTGGSYLHNNGLFRFDTPTYCVFNSNVTDLFYDLTIDQGHLATMNINISNAIRIENNLRLIDGECNLGTLQAEGNVFISPTYDRGTTSLHFAGAKAQTFDLTGATSNFDSDIRFVKSRANTITLLSPFHFTPTSRSIAFTKGYLVSSATNVFTLADNVPYTGGSDSSFVQGPMIKVGDDAFIFPVGRDSVYATITISAPASNNHQFRAEYFKQDPNPLYDRTLKVPSIHHVSACEYWLLDRLVGSSNVVVTLSWNTPRSCGVTNLSELIVTRWNGAQWVNHGNGATTGTPLTGTISSSGTVNSFSPFTLASITVNNPLPIELIAFQAELIDRKVELTWQTATEVNNATFVVEKSTTGKDWLVVSTQNGAGNSTVVLDYLSHDYSPSNGLNYYRLKQVDFDGEFTYSQIRSVDVNGAGSDDFILYPNPTSGIVFMQTSAQAYPHFTVSDVQGKTILNQAVDSDLIQFDLRQFPKGVYFVKYGDQVKKVVY